MWFYVKTTEGRYQLILVRGRLLLCTVTPNFETLVLILTFVMYALSVNYNVSLYFNHYSDVIMT